MVGGAYITLNNQSTIQIKTNEKLNGDMNILISDCQKNV